MFVKKNNTRFNMPMWTDERLVNMSSFFCLCTTCAKSDIRPGIICPIHEKFMKLTQELKIAGPIFACPEFVELEGYPNFLDLDYKPLIPSNFERIKDEWSAQLEKWESERNASQD